MEKDGGSQDFGYMTEMRTTIHICSRDVFNCADVYASSYLQLADQ